MTTTSNEPRIGTLKQLAGEVGVSARHDRTETENCAPAREAGSMWRDLTMSSAHDAADARTILQQLVIELARIAAAEDDETERRRGVAA